jgi:hypothetical protein
MGLLLKTLKPNRRVGDRSDGCVASEAAACDCPLSARSSRDKRMMCPGAIRYVMRTLTGLGSGFLGRMARRTA